eukprot:Skav218467  [mRNA]  locus=scaffold538:950598:955543:+ [translate_table: standard]
MDAVLPAPWAAAYERLASQLPIQQLEMNAWAEDSCPYSARYCAPRLPQKGTKASSRQQYQRKFRVLNRYSSLDQGPDDICLPQLDSSLLSSLTQQFSKQLDSLAASNITASVLADVNDAAGSILNSLDALGLVAFAALILGVTYMVLVRFFAKPVVWISLLLIFLLLLAAGALAVSKSLQCAEVDFLEFTGQAALSAVQNATQAALTAVQNVTGGAR